MEPFLSKSLIEALGAAAGACSMASFVPQIIKLRRTRKAEGVSRRTYALTLTAFVLWIAYGVMLGSWALVGSNLVNLTLVAVILILSLRYARASPPASEPS